MEALPFVARFAVCIGLASVLYTLSKSAVPGLVPALVTGTIGVAGWTAAPFAEGVFASGMDLVVDGFGLLVIEECTGAFEILILASAMLATPVGALSKLLGLLGGGATLYLLNGVRVGLLATLGVHYPAAFEFAHLYFWQLTLVAMIALVWLVWWTLVTRPPHARAPA